MEGDLRPPALSAGLLLGKAPGFECFVSRQCWSPELRAVQGVFFRDSTVQEANRLRLRGFVKNTPQGTVQGEVQGPADKAEQMKVPHRCRNAAYFFIAWYGSQMAQSHTTL